jgi:hypothetical protein
VGVEFARFQNCVLRYGPGTAMRSILRNMLIGRGSLHRGVVILLLPMILADLALPQVCRDELNCASGAVAVIPSPGGAEKDVLDGPLTGQQEQQPETPNSESGCFCCCAHILHSGVRIVDVATGKRPPIPLSVHFLPMSPPKDQFHPPRSV